MEYSTIWNKSKDSTFGQLQLFEKETLDAEDLQIEDFCLASLFEENIEDHPEELIDGNSKSEGQDSVELRKSLEKGNLDREGKTKQKSEIFSPYFPPLYAQPIIGFSP